MRMLFLALTVGFMFTVGTASAAMMEGDCTCTDDRKVCDLDKSPDIH